MHGVFKPGVVDADYLVARAQSGRIGNAACINGAHVNAQPELGTTANVETKPLVLFSAQIRERACAQRWMNKERYEQGWDQQRLVHSTVWAPARICDATFLNKNQ